MFGRNVFSRRMHEERELSGPIVKNTLSLGLRPPSPKRRGLSGDAHRNTESEERCGRLVSIHFDHVFAVVRGVADESLADRIDEEIEHFQGELTDQGGTIIGNLGDFDVAIAALNGETNGTIDVEGNDPRRSASGSSAIEH